MILYHGSNLIVDFPKLINQQRGLDFGAGFYLTTDEEQAVQFSRVVVKRNRSGISTVNVYEFEIVNAKSSLNVMEFRSADAEWLNFVTENRMKTYSGVVHDVVIGAVANDKVMPTLQAYLCGFLTKEATLLTLKTSKLTDQVCIKSEQALALLKYISSYNVGGA